MAMHKDLNILTFLHAACPDLVEKYFLRLLTKEKLPPYLIGMNPDYVVNVLDQIDETLRALIIEDFHRVNDICYRDLARMAAERFRVPLDPRPSTQTVALRLFLDYPRVFEFAWALYSYMTSYAQASQHWLQQYHAYTDRDTVATLKTALQSYFAAEGRGEECRLHVYDEAGELLVSVLHGSRLRTVACLLGHEVTINQFRLACNDVLIYDKRRALLSIKLATPRDREYYIHCFAGLMLGDEALANHASRDQIYTLKPLQKDGFAPAGNGHVVEVEIVKGTVKPHEPGYPVLIVEGNQRDWLDPSWGQLVEAKLRFTIAEGSKQKKSTVNIAVPCISDLTQKRYAGVISDYLREKGILRR